MKRFALTTLLVLTSIVLLSSCMIIVNDDDHTCEKDGSGDTITIIFTKSLSPTGL